MSFPKIDPPLINSANPWATTLEDLQRLFDCEHTGAVTVRTSLLNGFEHNDNVHQYTFFDPQSHSLASTCQDKPPHTFSASLNTLGYSPTPLGIYLSIITKVVSASTLPEHIRNSKPFIISVTGSAEAVCECYRRIQVLRSTIPNPLVMEVNSSCPNIPGRPPPAYSSSALIEYIEALAEVTNLDDSRRVAIGIKTPPYTYHDQFQGLIDALLAVRKPRCPIDFITATNTLGSSLVLNDASPAINSASGDGIGGMAGAALHPLALGNVKLIRSMLDAEDELQFISIIGVGGVNDAAGYKRMRTVGAAIVGVGTALGSEGVSVFEKILEGAT
ncbi:FMN-linked oxidoreductase [Polychaeton citri CBS 116435]|uniref:Dihydroorotate dehydrogenase (fumarate) n=1 Tax=Polychaeton citri CBS 116435 TaxID=1314669 RepID=A0A9P4URI2_9PEZI|nr:FMN-linked oxidoreductase [Polychaeton citri CBS 116435]